MAIPAVHSQNTAAKYTTQPNKSLTAAHESFLQKDLDAAAAECHKASAAVKKQSAKVSADAKAGMQKASAELDKCGDSVKAGTVKSDAEMKQCFAKVNR